jgi:peptidoglycan/xylan/chitin deacetylase (PgdA/CDA1 family)
VPAQLAVTFDVDAESAWLAADPAYSVRLSTLSEARYGVGRGLRRVLDLLDSYGARGTFYVPGTTVERHPDAVAGIVEAGHVIGHHGHEHLKTHLVSAPAQREEIDRGLRALRGLGVTPRGYRSPAWELTPDTLALLAERDFLWDSSLMDDDRPYRLDVGGGTLVELPVHWSLDDWPYFGWSLDDGGILADPEPVASVWERELQSAIEEQRPLTVTMHPEVIGRPHRLVILERLLRQALEAGIEIVTHEDLAAAFRGVT